MATAYGRAAISTSLDGWIPKNILNCVQTVIPMRREIHKVGVQSYSTTTATANWVSTPGRLRPWIRRRTPNNLALLTASFQIRWTAPCGLRNRTPIACPARYCALTRRRVCPKNTTRPMTALASLPKTGDSVRGASISTTTACFGPHSVVADISRVSIVRNVPF